MRFQKPSAIWPSACTSPELTATEPRGPMKLRLFVIFASFFVIFQSCGNTSESVSSPSGSAVMTQALYIYANDLTTAQQFQSLFSGTSVNLTIAAMSTLGAVNFSSYSIIILSDDSATSAPWGGAGSTTPAAIGKSGATLIGIGNGGSIFFDTLGFTAIGHLQSATNLSDQVSAVDPQISFGPRPIGFQRPILRFFPAPGMWWNSITRAARLRPERRCSPRIRAIATIILWRCSNPMGRRMYFGALKAHHPRSRARHCSSL